MKRLYATALTLTFLGSCAAPTTRPIDVSIDVMAREAEKQKELALESLAKDGERLFGVAFRLKTGAAEMCRDKVKSQIGFMASNLQLLERDLGPVAARVLGLTDAPKVTHIAPASPAYAAGFRKGDVLKTLNGWEVPTGENATKFFFEKLAQLGSSETAIFTVERAGQIATVQGKIRDGL